MFGSPIVKGNLNKSVDLKKAFKVRKPPESGDKGDFFKEVEEKSGHHGKKHDGDDFYKPDEVKLGNEENDVSTEEKKESVTPKNKADEETPGSMGKAIDIKI